MTDDEREISQQRWDAIYRLAVELAAKGTPFSLALFVASSFAPGPPKPGDAVRITNV